MQIHISKRTRLLVAVMVALGLPSLYFAKTLVEQKVQDLVFADAFGKGAGCQVRPHVVKQEHRYPLFLFSLLSPIYKQTVFSIALSSGNDEYAIALLKQYKNVKDIAADLRDPLTEAARQGRHEMMKALLDLGLDPNGTKYLDSPIEAAARKNDVIAIDLLVSRGASVKTEDGHKMTPLEIAASAGSVEAAVRLAEVEVGTSQDVAAAERMEYLAKISSELKYLVQTKKDVLAGRIKYCRQRQPALTDSECFAATVIHPRTPTAFYASLYSAQLLYFIRYDLNVDSGVKYMGLVADLMDDLSKERLAAQVKANPERWQTALATEKLKDFKFRFGGIPQVIVTNIRIRQAQRSPASASDENQQVSQWKETMKRLKEQGFFVKKRS